MATCSRQRGRRSARRSAAMGACCVVESAPAPASSRDRPASTSSRVRRGVPGRHAARAIAAATAANSRSPPSWPTITRATTNRASSPKITPRRDNRRGVIARTLRARRRRRGVFVRRGVGRGGCVWGAVARADEYVAEIRAGTVGSGPTRIVRARSRAGQRAAVFAHRAEHADEYFRVLVRGSRGYRGSRKPVRRRLRKPVRRRLPRARLRHRPRHRPLHRRRPLRRARRDRERRRFDESVLGIDPTTRGNARQRPPISARTRESRPPVERCARDLEGWTPRAGRRPPGIRERRRPIDRRNRKRTSHKVDDRAANEACPRRPRRGRNRPPSTRRNHRR